MRGNAVSTEQHFYSSMKPRWRCLERSTSFVPYLLYRDGIVHAEVGQEDGDFFHLTCLNFQQTDTHVVTLQCLLHVTLKQKINIHIFMSTGQKHHKSNNSLSVNVISLNILVSICMSALVKITKCVLMILLVIRCLETELSYLKGEVSCFEPVNSDGKREPVAFKQISRLNLYITSPVQNNTWESTGVELIRPYAIELPLYCQFVLSTSL